MPLIPRDIFTFNQNATIQRWMYHNSYWLVGGVAVPDSQYLGVAQLLVRPLPLNTPLRWHTIWSRSVYGPMVSFAEQRLPTLAAMQQIFGGTPTNQVILIRLLMSPSIAARSPTFTQLTNINSTLA